MNDELKIKGHEACLRAEALQRAGTVTPPCPAFAEAPALRKASGGGASRRQAIRCSKRVFLRKK